MPPPPLPVHSSSPNRSGMPSPGMLAPSKYSQRGSMPPPQLPTASCKSSTSSRPSFALSDGSDNNSVFGGRNSSNERIKTPLQDSNHDNVSTVDDVEAQFANLMVRDCIIQAKLTIAGDSGGAFQRSHQVWNGRS